MSLPEVKEGVALRIWARSECQNCAKGDLYLWRIAGRPCTEKKRIVLEGSYCQVRPGASVVVPKKISNVTEKEGKQQ